MRLRLPAFTVLLCCVAQFSPAALPRARAIDSPLEIGDRSQLAADRTWILSTEHAGFTLHPAKKHPSNPLVKADKPWEGWRIEIYGNVLFDEEEKLFKMWYVADSTPDFPTYATFYATSTDGIRWTKPPTGTANAAKGATGHNAVADACLLASVMKLSPEAEPDPARRYRMVAWVQKTKPQGGPHTFTSPDGLNWTPLSDKPICRSNDVITAYYDEGRKLYVAFPKLSTPVRGQVRRCFGITTSKDFLTWPEPRYIFQPDQRDDAGSLARIEAVRPMLDVPDDPALMRTEFYGIGVYVAESCTVAFPWVFTINNNARYGNHEGPGEIQFAVSRDLDKWERPFREPIVPRGKIGEWDSGFFTTPSRALRVGDEVWLYYGGSNYTHGSPCIYREEGTGRGDKFTGSIGLATWKLDRFVSVDGPAEGGTLTTVPVQFSGAHLELNAAVKPGGSVIVEVCDPIGKVLARSKPAGGDGLRLPVAWENGADVQTLAGKPVTLRFALRDAELFAFAFRK
jgi:hypothetical protein